MAHCAESGDEKIDFLRTPACLRQGEERNNQQRCSDVENQVAPAVENPDIALRHQRRDWRNSFWTRKGGDVLHGAAGALFSSDRGENQSRAMSDTVVRSTSSMRALSPFHAKYSDACETHSNRRAERARKG